ncbi:ThiF family adenylyltransferase [Dactylosporangium sp. NPDC005555]|uniref:HesA/MoeB/ThiF family protein n=1 Tax=Dactylosporangium sp. NPDC005555 TaxID=3154889 RepID=UPI0033ADF032
MRDAMVDVPHPGDAEQLKLVDAVAVVVTGQTIALVLGSDLLRIEGRTEWVLDLLDLLRAGTTASALRRRAGPVDATRLVDQLTAIGWITTGTQAPQPAPDTFDRQIGYLATFTPDTATAQERLRRSAVAVLGVGGIGATVVQHLAAAGIRRFHLIDDDTVALHNLNRQFAYTRDDIGAAKVDVLARRLEVLRPDGSTTLYRHRVHDADDLAVLPDDLDLLVVAADTPPTIMDHAWRWAEATTAAVTTAAVGLGSGHWGPLVRPGSAACWPCFEQQRRDRLSDLERSLEDALSAPTPYSFGPSNTAISGMLAHDIIEFLCIGTCPTFGRRAHLDFARQRLSHNGKVTCACPVTP